ncbi:MAG: hypothetical protein HS112_03845 [Zoogloeaceae bacterium]|nr:hypothetical protein [Zoogloeaceae bacterium]
MPLYHPIPTALTTLYGSIDGHAKSGAPVFPGSAGSISQHRNQNDTEYYVHRFYGGDGRQRETYIGTGEGGKKKAEDIRAQIEEVKALLPELRLLVREGFQAADQKTYATLASLHKHGLFDAGVTLVGSHAFGVLVNQIGVRAAAYATEDIDVARKETLAFHCIPGKGFLDMLRDSGIHFVEVPSLDLKKPSSSFKQAGASRFHVDLLVPSADTKIRVVGVPELKAYATALPFLGYVLGQTQSATLISREGCCPVRVPVAERFAIHKLVVSRLRTNRSAKSEKNIFQAAVLIAALGDKFPGAIRQAVEDLPVSARRYLVAAVNVVLGLMQDHPRACEELQEAIETNKAKRRRPQGQKP